MGIHTIDKEKLKKIFNQISGAVIEGQEPIPEAAIKGTSYIWCYEMTTRYIVRGSRGIKCYILDDTLDSLGRILVYTINNDVILIEESELLYTGFD